MEIKPKEFFMMMLNLLPSTVNKYQESIEYNGELLETVIIEDIFMPEIIKLLKENTEAKLLEEIFAFFEDVSNFGDEHLINIFSITTLEVLGNEKEILEVAKKYMGPKTTEFQMEADKDLGRI